MGVVCQVGQVGGQRIPLLRHIIRTSQKDRSEALLKADTLRWVKHHLDENEVAIIDAGVEISDMQTIEMPRYVIRMALKFIPASQDRSKFAKQMRALMPGVK